MIKSYRMNGYNVEKFIHQNDAEIIDGVDGCLLDDILLYARRGLIAIFETYVNPNLSAYTVHFSTDADEIYRLWDERKTARGCDDNE